MNYDDAVREAKWCIENGALDSDNADAEDVNTVIDLGVFHSTELHEHKEVDKWRVMLTSPYKIEVEQIKNALDKQIPKKPKIEGSGTTMWYACPTCGVYVTIGHGCHNNDCRQAIDWSVEKKWIESR